MSVERRNTESTVAALDLGSNSFHLLLARVSGNEISVVGRMKEMVRLAAGLDEDRTLSDEALDRGIACLTRFGQSLREFQPSAFRAVGTNTIRAMKNRQAFLEAAENALGRNIEIISGVEEARLVYLGVAHAVSDDGERRLVTDIGGGSTECILGEGFSPIERSSLYMGCVSYTQRFFPKGELTKEAFKAARLAARRELSPLREFRLVGSERALGSSGTIGAITRVLRDNGHGSLITPGGLKFIEEKLVHAKHIKDIKLPGLKPERAEVIAGGLCILRALFDAFEIKEMTHSTGALREGVIYDLLGRQRHEDRRDQSIRSISKRYAIDRRQAARVEKTALDLFEDTALAWGIQNDYAKKVLVWAARLHEIGLAISHTGYHKHGAYLLRHSDLAGFSIDDQVILAALVKAQRRRLHMSDFSEIGEKRALYALRCSILLRLAVLLHRGRRTHKERTMKVNTTFDRIELVFDEAWLEEHPLTLADLEDEMRYLKRVGVHLSVRTK